jgi:hypothetical protein
MTTKTFFLAWQAKENRGWFPIGQLDVDVEESDYRFHYVCGAKRAQEEVGFAPLVEFPDLSTEYCSSELFPTFRNRVIHRSRPDFAEYMSNLELDRAMNPIESLSISGGYRATDSYEIFPKIEKLYDGSFTCRFFLHGNRYTNLHAQEKVMDLRPGDNLFVTLQLNNPASGLAVQIQTEDYYMIGWAPRYLVTDLTAALSETIRYSAHVERVNPRPVPLNHRVLIEMNGRWDKHEPMSGRDFQPFVP